MMTTEMLTDLTAVSGYEDGLKAMPTIIRMWANAARSTGQKVVWLASIARRTARPGLELNEMGPGKMLGGALREGWRVCSGVRRRRWR